MKYYISSIAVLLVVFLGSYSYLFSAPVSDSCLYYFQFRYSTDFKYNPDSIKIDMCSDSPTYQHLFAKTMFTITFQPNSYPFDHRLDADEVKAVSDIIPSHMGLRKRLLEIQDTLGRIFFIGEGSKFTDSIENTRTSICMFFDNYQDIEFIKDYFATTIDSIREVGYSFRAYVPTDGVDKEFPAVNNWTVYPLPVKDNMTIIQSSTVSYDTMIELFTLDGQKLFESDYKDRIDVSLLHSGSYFLRINNQTIKFIKE